MATLEEQKEYIRTNYKKLTVNLWPRCWAYAGESLCFS